jgi:hypothetical protein
MQQFHKSKSVLILPITVSLLCLLIRRSNVVLRTKWEAWNSFRGISREQAMTEFLDLMVKFEADPRASTKNASTRPLAASSAASAADTGLQRTNSSRSVTSNAGGGYGNGVQPGSNVIKVGILYKQRDVFKGWRPRKFILCDAILHYFMEPDDPIPKKSMDISGCTITSIKPLRVGEVEYFPFVIAHPKAAKAYNLSSDSKAEVDDWIEKLRVAASKIDTYTNFVSNPAERLLGTQVPAESEGIPPATDVSAQGQPSNNSAPATGGAAATDGGKYKPVDAVTSLANIPFVYAAKIDKAVEALINAVEPNAPNWEPLFEKNGVVAKKRAGDVICVRGDGSMPFAIPDILNLLTNTSRMKEYNSQLNTSQMLKAFNNQTGD